jgi:integrase
MKAGPKYERNDLVFANGAGNPLDISCVRKRWKTILKASGLPSMRLYDARHTQASLLLASGVHPKVVQERLGHHSITLTMDTYSHATPTMQVDAVGVLKDALKVAASDH